MRWGLVPHWSSHEDRSLSTINARAESVIGGGGLWGTLRGKKHCVVVADGYAELKLVI
jgi:putative SOS response-associated peptidase YedK